MNVSDSLFKVKGWKGLIKEDEVMSQIEEFEQRIKLALDRIGKTVEAVSGPAGQAAASALQQELDVQKKRTLTLEQELARARDAENAQQNADAGRQETLRDLDSALQSLRQVNDDLIERNQALRDAASRNAGDAGMINTALQAELDALKAARDADRAEMALILAELEGSFDVGAQSKAGET